MSLDGLRAWIGEVERKLGMRTRVFLALAAIAIGGAGAAIYLAVDTREDAVSESDVQALQERLEEQIAGGGVAAQPEGTGGGIPEAEAPGEADAPDDGETPQGAGDGGVSSDGGASAPPKGAAKARLRDLIQQAKKQNAEAKAAEEGE